jgi:tRNA 2-selenouridine synthase
MVETITYSKSVKMDDIVYIDTRSPGEFEIDHIPGSINVAILDNDERKLVGTMYKQVSQNQAIEKGLEIYEKKIEEIKKTLSDATNGNNKTLVIYCWRGGMRSKTITKLATKDGIKCFQLKEGYKKYREYIRINLHDFKLKSKLVVLHGLTGSGKTDLLVKFKDMIDLEGMAAHRSSLFGSIGLTPNTQKRFETLLFEKLNSLNGKENILIEGESRKIGNIIMPEFLHKAMKKGINVKVDCKFESRVGRLVDIYTSNNADINKTKEITKTLTKKLGKKIVSEMIESLEKNELDKFMKIILEKYYDPLYKYSIEDLKYDLDVNSDDMNEAVEKINEKYKIQ